MLQKKNKIQSSLRARGILLIIVSKSKSSCCSTIYSTLQNILHLFYICMNKITLYAMQILYTYVQILLVQTILLQSSATKENICTCTRSKLLGRSTSYRRRIVFRRRLSGQEKVGSRGILACLSAVPL